MDFAKKLSLAFAAGCVGTMVFYAGLRLGMAVGVIKGPPGVMTTLASLGFLYKQIVWGGIWGFAFVIPVLTKMWWARGLIVGLLASLAAFFIFRPAPPPLPFIIIALVLNMGFWGLAAAYWNDKVLKNA